MAKDSDNGDSFGPRYGDAFKMDCASVIALSEALQALPALIHAAKGMMNGITRPQSDDSIVWGEQIGRLQEWIFCGKPSITIIVPDAIIPLLIAIRKDPGSSASSEPIAGGGV